MIRLWGCIRAGPTDEWIEARAQFWDKFVKKSSALQTALIRCLREEAASALGATVANGLVDITCFYDHIDLGKLLTYAVEWGFPPQVLALSLTTVLGPRVLELGGWTSKEPCAPRRSALTGERHGNHKARLLLYSTLEAMHYSNPALHMGQWVDDLHLSMQTAKGPATRGMVESIKQLVACLIKDRLIMADKTVVMSNCTGVAQEVAKALRSVGIVVRTAVKGTDLGVDTGCGRVRARAKHQARGSNARERCIKVKTIARTAFGRKPAG